MSRFLADLSRCLGLAAAAALMHGAALSSAAAQSPARPTIAVLPLENSSGEATQDFFAGGMTDEIASALTSARGLDVVARSSAFQVKNRNLESVGQALNASYLVQGSALLAAGRVRLNVSLVQAGAGTRLWSKEYDAELAKIFDVEEDIAESVATALKAPANPGEPLVRSRTRDLDAYL